MAVLKLLKLGRVLGSIKDVICFDLKIDSNVVHVFSVVSFRTGTIFDPDGNQIDYTWERKWNSLRILCDSENVIILKKNDTLFNGTYEQLYKLKGNDIFSINNISYIYQKTNMPVMTIYPTCDLTMKRIYELISYFPERDTILFQFGKYFNCTDILHDIRADTLLKVKNTRLHTPYD